ncbi:MAG: SCO family protein [Myxococcota bacterium]
MSTARSPRSTALMAFGPVVVAGLAAALLALAQPAPEIAPHDRLPTPRTLVLHGLVDSDGYAFDHRALEGHHTLVFSGFTACPNICPATLSVLTAAVRTAAATLGDATPEIVFVTVDPGRDDPPQLATYLAAFDPPPRGVTGSTDDLEGLLDSLGFISRGLDQAAEPSAHQAHAHPEHAHPEHVTRREPPAALPHSTAIALVGPDGRAHALFRAPHDPTTLATRIIDAVRGSPFES